MNIKWIIALTVLIIVQDTGISGKDVRVKLCGREFIRMVVTLCGSSRLRRSAPEIRPVSIRPHAIWYSTDLIPNLTQMKSSSEDQTEIMLNSSSSSSSSSSLNFIKSQEISRPRLRRDVGPAGVCCRSGCTKTELVQYC
ncbi:insulin-like 3 (Leydig cell) [Clarias gariepinus]|uniref:insulin-like 3 (Leydig cell) n=1 Tax=Clarias gariepinus TaxID=13013 RepID=UPI00234CB60B|nr:insulin-like 3 (Leydig cell) [Clarias gariepinus]